MDNNFSLFRTYKFTRLSKVLFTNVMFAHVNPPNVSLSRLAGKDFKIFGFTSTCSRVKASRFDRCDRLVNKRNGWRFGLVLVVVLVASAPWIVSDASEVGRRSVTDSRRDLYRPCK